MKHKNCLRSKLSLPLSIAIAIVFVIGSPIIIRYIALAAAPVVTVTSPADGDYLNTVTPTVYGSTYANSTVNVYIDDSFAGSTTADGDGDWYLKSGTLAEVAHSVYATATNGAGETGTSSVINFTVDITPPEVDITFPQLNSYVNLPLIEGTTEPEAEVTVYVYGRSATVQADMLGYWFYFDETLPEGSHTVYATAVDKAGNDGTSLTHNFVLDMTRPVISTLLYPPDVMTRVYLEQTVALQVYDDSPLDQTYMSTAIAVNKLNSVDGTVDTSVYGTVYGTVYFNADTKQITFLPDTPFEPKTKYIVTVNPFLADLAGNLINPRTWTFTTMAIDTTQRPHGDYIDNVNTCVNCHTPHRATGPRLNRPLYTVSDSIENYCMACHDGTVAPLPEKWGTANKHNFEVSITGTSGTNSCASCHDPHLTWTTENPNLLQDYYVYPHNDPTNPYLPDTSEKALCESCHTADIKNDPAVQYVRYQSETRHTTGGTLQDYGLCLRCHDGSNAVNIAGYYTDETSRHLTVALDGSPLNGHLACADCHETHGSPNLKLLKTAVGHNNAQPFTSGQVWDAAAERQFCTGCHNNYTELYGITVGFDSTIPGHEADNTDACHQCHGGSPIVAAHAPK